MASQKQVRYNPAADYYRTLGVSQSASIDEIRRVYRQRAKEVHPDTVHPSRKAWATRQFQQINEAHDVLGDPASKAGYDKQRFLYLSAAFRKTPVPPSASSATRGKKPGCLFLLMIGAYLISVLAGLTHSWSSDSGNNNPPLDVEGLFTDVPASVQLTRMPCPNPDYQITEPLDFTQVSKPMIVRGTAGGKGFARYSVILEMGSRSFHLAEKVDHLVENGTLVNSSLPSVPAGAYVLRLDVDYKNGDTQSCEVHIVVNNE